MLMMLTAAPIAARLPLLLCRFQIYREVQLHARLQHQNVITLFGAFQQDNQVRCHTHAHVMRAHVMWRARRHPAVS